MEDPSQSAAWQSRVPAPLAQGGALVPAVHAIARAATVALALVAITAFGRRLTGDLRAVESWPYLVGNLAVLSAAALIVLSGASRALTAIAAASAASLAVTSTLPGVAPLAWLAAWSLAALLVVAATTPDRLRLALEAARRGLARLAADPEIHALLGGAFARPAKTPEPAAAESSAAPVADSSAAATPSPAAPTAERRATERTLVVEPLAAGPASESPADIESADDEELDEIISEGDELEEAPLDEADASELRCELTRRRSADGVECWSGKLYIDLAPGRRAASEHVAFCPPMPAAPHVEFRQVSGPAARVQATEIRTFGMRWEVKLAEAPREPVRVVVAFSAYAAPQATGRAA